MPVVRSQGQGQVQWRLTPIPLPVTVSLSKTMDERLLKAVVWLASSRLTTASIGSCFSSIMALLTSLVD